MKEKSLLNVLPVVEDARVLPLLLRGVEEAAHEADDELLEDPLQHSPEDPEVLVLEVARVVLGKRGRRKLG